MLRRTFISFAAIWSLLDRVLRIFRREPVDLADVKIPGVGCLYPDVYPIAPVVPEPYYRIARIHRDGVIISHVRVDDVLSIGWRDKSKGMANWVEFRDGCLIVRDDMTQLRVTLVYLPKLTLVRGCNPPNATTNPAAVEAAKIARGR